jgi:hypothetical protein
VALQWRMAAAWRRSVHPCVELWWWLYRRRRRPIFEAKALTWGAREEFGAGSCGRHNGRRHRVSTRKPEGIRARGRNRGREVVSGLARRRWAQLTAQHGRRCGDRGARQHARATRMALARRGSSALERQPGYILLYGCLTVPNSKLLN